LSGDEKAFVKLFVLGEKAEDERVGGVGDSAGAEAT
jgi:hypothetical protein